MRAAPDPRRTTSARGARPAAWRLPSVLLLQLGLAASCADSGELRYVRVDEPLPAGALDGLPQEGATLLVFFATWCPPCVEELPGLRRLAAAPGPGLQVVLLAADARPEATTKFFGGTLPPELHVRWDPGKRIAGELRVDQLPVSFLVVAGRVVARFDGAREWDGSDARATLARLARPPER